MEQNRQSRSRPTCQVIFNKDTKAIEWRKGSLLNDWEGWYGQDSGLSSWRSGILSTPLLGCSRGSSSPLLPHPTPPPWIIKPDPSPDDCSTSRSQFLWAAPDEPDPLLSAVQGKDEILHKAPCVCPPQEKGDMEPLGLLILLFVTGRIPSLRCLLSLSFLEYMASGWVGREHWAKVWRWLKFSACPAPPLLTVPHILHHLPLSPASDSSCTWKCQRLVDSDT